MKNLFTLLLISLLVNFSLDAQNTIEGGISNKTGESLVAIITLENEQDAQLSKSIQTDEHGYFIVDNLEDGSYRLVVKNDTYSTITMANFEFPRDADQILGLTMESMEDLKNTAMPLVRNTPNNPTSIAEVYK